MKKKMYIAVLLLASFVFPSETHAIPPPDVITTIGSSFAQIASLAAVLVSLGLSFAFRYIKQAQSFSKKYPAHAALVSLAIVVLAAEGAYLLTKSEEEVKTPFEEEVVEKLQEAIEEHDITEDPEEVSAFFKENESMPLTVSNEEFRAIPQDAFVLDAREDEEYEIGFYPGSTHIRFADILAGGWRNLPTDRIVYVICWSGLRGGEVASFLREKGIVGQALEEGANGWVEDGGMWEGEIAFSHVYSKEQYSLVFTTEEVQALQSTGAILVDARQQNEENAFPIPGSINISSIYTPTDELEVQLGQVAAGSRVITVCDDFVSCFDAKIVGIKLEKRGATFLGRFASPWEF